MELEVLIELQESKRAIKLTSDPFNRVEEIRNGLKLIDPVIHVELGVAAEGTAPQPNTAPFILQRYCPEWGNYLDITNVDEIQHRDRLRVIPRPSIISNTSSNTHHRLTAVEGPSSSGTNVSSIMIIYLFISTITKMTMHHQYEMQSSAV